MKINKLKVYKIRILELCSKLGLAKFNKESYIVKLCFTCGVNC